jgi:hypothetical protein
MKQIKTLLAFKLFMQHEHSIRARIFNNFNFNLKKVTFKYKQNYSMLQKKKKRKKKGGVLQKII